MNELVLSIVAFVLASFFAGSETAIIVCDRIRLRHLANGGDRRARLVLDYIDNPEYFLSIVLVGTNLGVIACTTTFTAVMIRYFGDSGTTIATMILVPTLMIFQEIVPKGIFLYYADRAAILSIYPLKFFAIVLYPVIHAFTAVTNVLMRRFKTADSGPRINMTMEELLFHLKDSRAAGLISAGTMQLASRALDLLDFTAKDVMLPLDRVVMVEEGLSADEYQEVFAKERFSRLPAYRDTPQNVVGILTIHNLLKSRSPKPQPIRLEPPYVVRMDRPIVEVLTRMKNQGTHTAMISDESGTLVGMATLEDILERLVGAIADEFH